jgi:hypothetical protein
MSYSFFTTNPRVSAACNRVAALVRNDRPLDVACDEIEQLWNRQQRPSGSQEPSSEDYNLENEA